MQRRKVKLRVIWSGLTALLLVGVVSCSPHDNAIKTAMVSPSPSKNETTTANNKTTYYSGIKTNGSPISVTRIPNPKFTPYAGMPQGTKLYSLMYWSQGNQVQAYVVVPPSRTPLPLLVNLHGGYFLKGKFHTNKFPTVTKQVAEDWAESGYINFLPNYAGYGPSGGDVGSSYGSYLDTKYGLQALSATFGSKIEANHTELYGVSMGGFVAMKLAETDHQVKAIVLVSPWPGGSDFVSWIQSQPSNQVDQLNMSDYFAILNREGTNNHSSWYVKNSIIFRDVKVPVLIVGGKSDPIIPPSLLSQLKAELSKYDANVELEFVPGGHAPTSYQVVALSTFFLNSH
ncbi:alpha/beta hydrolase family protein [Alicyclobacillus sp. ALC3]|uniref:alpha/beta hydrolase family protein n=1 Tax=Alicyclobacillus sp. ALC3 TaxID=2796143 RepID=UPI00237833D3|nr:alpha/beta hydrolase [Alicyclobacillus sp. ALC3]WDL98459.1 alpha/beta hydrolase [Alicyclobacillus sp. ALC3]